MSDTGAEAYLLVVARSDGDEAIFDLSTEANLSSKAKDCFGLSEA
jgi:hypothetical protein